MSAEMQSYEMMVVAFKDEDKADEVLSTLKQMDVEATVDLKSAAVVKRDAEGKVRIKEKSREVFYIMFSSGFVIKIIFLQAYL